jgi:hypothetical protein
MASVVLELSDHLVEQAKVKGLLSSELYEDFIRRGLRATDDTIYPPDFPDFLKGVVDPAMFRKGSINGDIIGPFYEEWGMTPPAETQVLA